MMNYDSDPYFFSSSDKDPFHALSSWNDSLHYCQWRGVSCSRRHPDRVTALIFNSRGLTGPLSPHIGNLSFLNVIDFQNNSFNGRIPQEIGRLRRLRYLILANNSFGGNIPANLSSCSELLYLDLIDNKLTGNIPAELGSLPKLGALGLGRNNLTGTIPPSIGNLSSLYQISIRTNNLHGQIPEELSQLVKLKDVLFGENNLIGEIPYGLFNISSIEIFNFIYNQLQGGIPSDIGLTLPKLSSLALAYNKFTGSIPVTLSNASTLERFAFSSNHFTGSIPKDLGKLPRLLMAFFSENQLQDDLSFIDSLTNCSGLQQIHVERNFFNGSIPKSIANLSKDMWFLGLSENQLQNGIPLGLENLVNLRFLQLGWNYLSGRIPIDFGRFPYLQYLTLSSNNFTGTIPSSFGNLTFLTILYMRANNFHGSIPPNLGNCRSLIELDLGRNNLNGSIPKEVIGLSSLSVGLYLSQNELTGVIPSEIGLLQNLVSLDLSNNRFSGIIPKTIGECSKLEGLYLSDNSFEGEIPQALSFLHGLRELDISGNNFSGKIPDSLAGLDGLSLLNLSFNRLEGEVPKQGLFLNASEISLLGNNLCGGIKELKLPPCPSSKSTKNTLSPAQKILISVFSVALFLLVLTSFLIFWYRKRTSRSKGISMPSFNHQFLRLSYAELFKATDGFSESNIVGTGGYSSVYKGILDQTAKEVAVKVLNLHRKGASNSFLRECEALRTIRHRNLMKLLSACSSIDFKGNDFKALVYEFMSNGSLEKWLYASHVMEDGRQIESISLKLMHRLNIAIDIASALEYLHNGCPSTIIHGELKPSNVLLDDEMTAYVGDFGLAKIVSTISVGSQQHQHQSSSLAIKGTIGYVAPEYGMSDMVSVEGDIYSYGIMLLEMFTGKKPTDNSFTNEVNLHVFVERSLPYKVMEIVDPRILIEDGRGTPVDCLVSVLRIGVYCSMEQPTERMKMVDVIRELQKVKDVYMNELREH
ncbi:hypothetical protein JCGZ_14809 [Jatropha curcas]|uniref:non-specific serine/threonine protein kinase n=1 Tax=Jatropha curcas TaxID=180498 RepID=A0A067KIB5_JATCU|nr:probable LRR receptor-like serine/threonine-protein kinase At3g47570 [Jatropha curcas]KDP31584.1 hypothetical protein JCGZ_14809 [Jatropha curcas]